MKEVLAKEEEEAVKKEARRRRKEEEEAPFWRDFWAEQPHRAARLKKAEQKEAKRQEKRKKAKAKTQRRRMRLRQCRKEQIIPPDWLRAPPARARQSCRKGGLAAFEVDTFKGIGDLSNARGVQQNWLLDGAS